MLRIRGKPANDVAKTNLKAVLMLFRAFSM